MSHQIKHYIIDPLIFLLIIFAGSSLAGWASLLWDGKVVSLRRLVAGTVLSGFAGLLVALMLWNRLIETDPALLAMVSLLAGVGGTVVLDVLLAGFLRILIASLKR